MQVATEPQPPPTVGKSTPRWVPTTLLIGAAIAVAWAAFLSQFMNEPSAVGRSKVVLVIWAVASLTAAVLALPAAIMLRRRDRSARVLAWIVSVLITATFVGAIAGIPALIGLAWSRKGSRP